MCRMLAEKYNMVRCEENYNMDVILSVVTQKQQPNLNYFNSKVSWQEYVSRTPDEFYTRAEILERVAKHFEL